uniref:Uncharacterized protein n=1 Tax=Anguilla anguilla TaxID=7936 RepID=A0A0E9PC59_ANGAN
MRDVQVSNDVFALRNSSENFLGRIKLRLSASELLFSVLFYLYIHTFFVLWIKCLFRV